MWPALCHDRCSGHLLFLFRETIDGLLHTDFWGFCLGLTSTSIHMVVWSAAGPPVEPTLPFVGVDSSRLVGHDWTG